MRERKVSRLQLQKTKLRTAVAAGGKEATRRLSLLNCSAQPPAPAPPTRLLLGRSGRPGRNLGLRAGARGGAGRGRRRGQQPQSLLLLLVALLCQQSHLLLPPCRLLLLSNCTLLRLKCLPPPPLSLLRLLLALNLKQ